MMRKIISMFVVLLFVLMTVMPPCGYADVLPQGGNFVNGDGTITVNGQVMNINQMSSQAIIEWLSFCISQGYTVNINQPGASSVSLNRVTGADPSVIMGNLLSNGQVFLVNPNGILFGASSYVNAPGVVASTLGISNQDFLNGNYTFLGQGSSVINQGLILAPGGYVTLLGTSVDNSGTIVSELGTVTLAAGEEITMSLDPQGLVSIVIDEGVTQNVASATDAVRNTGTISAEGGRVVLTAEALNGLFTNVVNNEGIIEARSLMDNEGSVYLIAKGENSVVSNTGTIDVSPSETGAQGGFIELSGGTLDYLNGTLESGQTGTLFLDPWNISISNLDEFLWNLWGGSVILEAGNNISFDLSGDNLLDLYNLGYGEIFQLSAGNNIYMNDDSVRTAGGDIAFYTDNVDGWFFEWSTGILHHVTPNGEGTISLGSGNGLESNGGNITLVGADVDLTALVNAGSGDVFVEATSGDLNISNASISADTTWIWAENNINLSGGASVAAGSLASLWAQNDISLDDASVSGSAISIFAENDINMTGNASVDAGLVANITADHNMNMADDSSVSAIDSVSLKIGNNMNMESNTSIHSDNFATIDAGNDVKLGLAQAGNLLIIDAGGAISDNNGGATNIIADRALLSAANGIGSGNALETTISSLQATNTLLGNIDINNSGNLALTDLSGLGYAVKNFNGDITINSSGDLNVNNDVVSSWWITLLADNDINLSGDALVDAAYYVSLAAQNDINLLDDASVLSGSIIDFHAGNNINMSGNAIVDSGYIANITAGQDMNMSGNASIDSVHSSNIIVGNDMNMSDTASVSSNVFTTINAGNDVKLGLVQADNLVIIDAGGAISDNNEGATNIIADRALLSAANGIGSGNAIETDINILRAYNVNGNIEITDLSGDLEVFQVLNSASGDIKLTASDAMTVRQIEGNDEVVLTADTIDSIASYVPGMSSQVIKADALKLIAINGIGVGLLSGGSGLLTDVNHVIASNVFNGINIRDVAGDLNVIGAETLSGDIDIASAGNLTLGGFGITIPQGTARLTSDTGAIIDGNGDNWNINAKNIVLNAVNGIGSNDMLEVYTNNLTAENSTLGDIRIKDINGNFYVDSVINNSLDGSVYLIANGAAGEYNPCYYDPNKDMFVGTVKSKNDVYLESTRGSIIDYNGSDNNITAENLILSAVTGIGSGNALETEVSYLQATNIDYSSDPDPAGNVKSSGNIEINNQGDLTLSDLSGLGYSVKNLAESLGGDVFIESDGSILGEQGTGYNIISSGDTHLTAGDIIGSWAPYEPLTVDVGGDLYLKIGKKSGVQATGSVGSLGVSGALAGNIGGNYYILPGSKVSPNNPFIGDPSGYIFFNSIEIWPLGAQNASGAGRILASTEKIDKAYWEILDPYRYASFSQSTPVFYLYHPLNETDEEAFEDINLDADAYEFIEEKINLKKDLDPYFGWLDGQDVNQDLI